MPIRRSRRELVALFHARFDPRSEASKARAAKEAGNRALRIEAALADGASRSMKIASCAASSTLVQSALRTNFYQIGDDGGPRQQIAIKFESRKLDDAAGAAAAL